MPDNVNNIQDQVRFLARDDSIDITGGTGLGVANRVNRGMAALIQPVELTSVDSTITTVSATEAYPWTTAVVFTTVLAVELPDANSKHQIIKPPPNEFRWTQAGAAANGFPWFYRRINAAGIDQIAFRPIPDFIRTVRITGAIEPTAFSDGASVTPYLQFQIDDSLARLIAAEFLGKRAQGEMAGQLIEEAAQQLGSLVEKEIKPQQLKELVLDA